MTKHSALRGFTQPHHVEGRASIADLFRSGKRCGIYVLHFANGEYYVGQATDVTRRFVQHCRNHCDIRQISFKRVRKNKSALDVEESAVIRLLEADGCRLRNIQLASMPYGETDFDLIMPPQDQERWLNDLDFQDLAGDRVVNPDLRRRYSKRFALYEQLPFAAEVTQVLREYVRASVPGVRRGEVSFWACSCLPQSLPGEPGIIYSRINVGWQTAFQATAFDGEKEMDYSWYLTKPLLEEAWGEPLPAFEGESVEGIILSGFEESPDLEVFVTSSPLKAGGQDQVFVSVAGWNNAMVLTGIPYFLTAVRKFNRSLMKKGPCSSGRYHCMDLADRLID
ncbi:MAG: hypothetical protein M5R40_11310 [Anaerolineae bacterium]|nr:hypothetical protein [Anaerolineae bacterium]